MTITAGATTTKDFSMSSTSRPASRRSRFSASRGEQRTVISAPVPIDVLSAADLLQSGRTETAQMIQAVAPSFNFPRATIADGTDHIRPATLRGLSPDQTLMLINGKRRHASALVNLNGFVGRGAQAVDLNAIPASMIDHIEILRDGAAAQYGSDAIAGVINIVLKTNAPGSFSIGIRRERHDVQPRRDVGARVPGTDGGRSGARRRCRRVGTRTTDGRSARTGTSQLGGEVRNRDGTNRTLADTRPQYFAGDPRNSAPPPIDTGRATRTTTTPRLFFNGGHTFGNGIELYGSAATADRAARRRACGVARTTIARSASIYPDGFLPFIKSEHRRWFARRSG